MRSPEPPARSASDARYTVLVVPEGGRGEVWQRSVPLRRVRQGIAAGGTSLTLLLVLAGVQVATLPRVLDYDALVAENLEIKVRLEQVDQQMTELAPLVQRVRVYDERLRDLEARSALPGFGPLDREEIADRQAWIDAVVAAPSRRSPALPAAVQVAGLDARLAGVQEDLEALAPGLGAFEALLARFDEARSVLPQLWPIEDAVLTSPFGYRRSPFGNRWKMHTGLDLGAPYGTPILSTNDGLVSFAGWDSGHGYMVEVDHGREVTTRYCHASRLLVASGDAVSAGDLLALVGSTGMSTGPHLHYELIVEGERVDPLEYLP